MIKEWTETRLNGDIVHYKSEFSRQGNDVGVYVQIYIKMDKDLIWHKSINGIAGSWPYAEVSVSQEDIISFYDWEFVIE